MFLKWKKVGTFVIDMSIIGMFYQVAMYFVTYFIHPELKNIVYDGAVFILYMLIYIAIATLYQLVSFKLLKQSMGHYFLRLKVCNIDKSERTMNQVFKREFHKYYMLFVTLFTYELYCFYLVVFKNQPTLLDKKFNTIVE